jgi:hypothetical protein
VFTLGLEVTRTVGGETVVVPLVSLEAQDIEKKEKYYSDPDGCGGF